MAKALVAWSFETGVPGTSAGRVTIDVPVLFVGADLPGGIGVDRDIVRVDNLDVSLQPAQISAAVIAAVRARATALGYPVGNNEVVCAGLVKG